MDDWKDNEVLCAFFAQNALAVALINLGILNRERFIDQLLDLMAGMPPEQKASHYGRYVEIMIQVFERTQFPYPGSEPKPVD
ncbi:hypothetical protein BPNPMPFG_005046 [Mesorhizobium sp. AR07]|uniref:hypothetical protein n=1 Tax=Mesorhizobium sp. AR07 TaxID=2865838 RepID=UPI002160A59F|nr:hypothetical protein [Mesorhizobium sp. AR07]UVK43268.1 hypothetical protein BPNPMPFG_005046 [Mesorhizobium sp. AR07]